MLTAYADHLKRLSNDEKDPFFWHVRRRIGKRATSLMEKRMRKFVLASPLVVSRIYELSNTPEMPARLKSLGGYLLTYLYHPHDFIPEDKTGLFGYFDDAYLSAAVYDLMIKEMQEAKTQISDKDLSLWQEISKLKKIAAKIISEEAEKIERMLRGIRKNEDQLYLSIFN